MRARGIAAAIVAALTLGVSTSAQAQATALESGIVEAGSSIPATLFDDRLTVGVTIAGAGPYPFIVDTAAERTVIARELATELGLETVGRARLLSIASSRSVEQVRMRDVTFLPGSAGDLRAFTVQGEHIGAAGVLGIDALQNQRVTLDFANNTMTVTPSHNRIANDPDAIVVRARRRLGQLILTQSTMEGVEVDVIVDSGLQVSVGNEALRRLLHARTNRNAQQIAITSVTGDSVSAEYAVVNEFRISSIRLGNLPIAFTNAHVFQRLGMTRRPALFLGMDALRLFERVSVDFANRRASFVMADDTPVAREGSRLH